MDPTKMTPQEWLMYAAVIGFIVGLVPLITGLVKRNIKYGLVGLIGSTIGGAVLGLILAIPVAAFFTWMIIRGSRQPDPAPVDPAS
jgi:hypothetical protein